MFETMIKNQTAKQAKELAAWMARREETVARPVLLNLHGGGFLLGSKEVNRYLCTDLSRRGFLVMSLEYPLAPEATIFDIFRALTAGIDRAAALAADYGGDPAQLYLCGDSAGAYLCYYLAALQNAPEAAQAAGVPQIKTKSGPSACRAGCSTPESSIRLAYSCRSSFTAAAGGRIPSARTWTRGIRRWWRRCPPASW